MNFFCQHAVMTWPILERIAAGWDFFLSHEEDFSLLSRPFSSRLRQSFSQSLIHPLCSVVAAGVARIHPRRGISPLKLDLGDSNERERERERECVYVYVCMCVCSRPFSSRFDVHPGQDISLVLELPSTRSDRKRAAYPHVPPINQNPLHLNYRGTRS